ncbi:MAG: hypothetical protein R3A10_02785 [Caldilineaceae bacterium]
MERYKYLLRARLTRAVPKRETGEQERLRLPDVYIALDTTTRRRNEDVNGQRDQQRIPVKIRRLAPLRFIEEPSCWA